MYLHLNKIGWLKQTQGSEPSQYLEEEKTTVIPLVAASERGTAYTMRACPYGVVGSEFGVTKAQVSGTVWKDRP